MWIHMAPTHFGLNYVPESEYYSELSINLILLIFFGVVEMEIYRKV